MTISRLAGTSTAEYNFETAKTATWPSGVTANSVAVLIVSHYSGGGSAAQVPSGFTQRLSATNSGNTLTVMTKECAGTESGTFNVTLSAPGYGSFVFDVYDGTGDLTYTSISSADTGSSSDATMPSVSGTSGQLLLGCFALSDPPGTTNSNPSGMTIGTSSAFTTNSARSYYQVLSSTGATGSKTWDFTNSRDWLGASMLVSEAGSGASTSPGAGSLTITGAAPTITTQRSISTGVGALSITGYAPAVSLNTPISAGAGALSITGYAPSVTRQIAVTPSVGALSISGVAPTITQQISVASQVGALVISGQAPTAQVTEAGAVTPGAGLLAITGYAPTVTQQISVQTTSGALILTGAAPSVTTGHNVTPGVGALTLGGLAPTLTQAIVITPAAGELTLAGYAPSAELPDKVVTTDVAALIITGYAPTVEGGTPVGRADTGAGKAKRTRRRLQVEIDGEVFDVRNRKEAEELLSKVREEAKAKAEQVVERANKAERRRPSKIVQDARRALKEPVIEAPPIIADVVSSLKSEIKAMYSDAIMAAEIAALMRRRDEDDDEDVLLLML